MMKFWAAFLIGLALMWAGWIARGMAEDMVGAEEAHIDCIESGPNSYKVLFRTVHRTYHLWGECPLAERKFDSI